jgi:opacity protein-like surface antigen
MGADMQWNAFTKGQGLNLKAVAWFLALVSGHLHGETLQLQGRIPEEYESMGGHGLSLNNAAVAATDGAAAVRINPALLARQKLYTLTAGYHWPTQGREFYQAGVVDGKTAKIAAGFSYTSFMEDYRYARINEKASAYDSPISKRAAVGVGQAFESWFLGLGATYIEASPFWNELVLEPNRQDDPEKKKGFGLNLGLSTTIGSQLDLGASIENASNAKINSYLPQTVRAGAAYRWSGELQFVFDYRSRTRVPEFEATQVASLESQAAPVKLKPEQMVLAGFEAQVQDVIRVSGSFGSEMGQERRCVAAGVAVVNKGYSISYAWSRPVLAETASHQAVSLSFELAM